MESFPRRFVHSHSNLHYQAKTLGRVGVRMVYEGKRGVLCAEYVGFAVK